MTITEKIVAVRDKAGLNQNRFSQLIGVAPSTMTRLERGTPSRPSLETLQKIAAAFKEITVEWLEDEADEQLPPTLTIVGDQALNIQEHDHEGHSLRRFVESNKPRLNQVIIANQMGVSRNQVGSYYSTERFRNSVRKNLITALGSLLGRAVTDAEVFGRNLKSALNYIPANLVAVPPLSVADRPKATLNYLSSLQENFIPALLGDKVMYAPAKAIPADSLKRAFAIEISASDRMEPLYFPGYWVLGLTLDSADYPKIHDGSVAIMTTDGEFMVKKVLANNLRTEGIIQVGTYGQERVSSIQLRQSDIQVMFKIVGIINGMLS